MNKLRPRKNADISHGDKLKMLQTMSKPIYVASFCLQLCLYR